MCDKRRQQIYKGRERTNLIRDLHRSYEKDCRLSLYQGKERGNINYVRTSDYSGYPQENLLSGGGWRESFAKLSAKLDPPDLLSQELDKSPERRSENYPSLIVSSTPPGRPGNTAAAT